jgi:uncharacterized membrane protein
MMKKILALAVLFSATTSMAVQVTCQFTEPFVTVKYQTLTGQMEVIAEHYEQIPVISDLEAKLVNSGENQVQVNVTNSSNQTLLQIIPDGKGSDGMSDRVFPYSAVLTLPDLNVKDLHLEGPLHGGCETELRRATEN